MADENLNLNDLQAAISAKNANWQAGETSVSRLSEPEKKKRLGYKPGPEELSLTERENKAAANLANARARAGAIGFPASFDWRNSGGNNFITSIKDQGNCGSCVSFGTISTMEGTYQVIKNNPNSGIDLSEAQLFYCYGADNGATCDTGWYPDVALNCLKQGVADEACFPYVDSQQDCSGLCSDAANRTKKISDWHQITDHDQMKDWLSTKGPLVTCFSVYDDFFNYTSGVYHYTSGNLAGGHCVCAVGYSEDEGGYWICKNQWSTGFGENGYFRIGYGEVGIDATMWAIDGIVEAVEGEWLSNKYIVGLWAIDQDRNAFAFIDGTGWKQIANDNDYIFINMLSQLLFAKASRKTVSAYIVNGVITQLYVNS
jgi:C1A family cysteine protease